MRHSGTRSVVTAAGGASSKGGPRIASQIERPAGPAAAFSAIFWASHETTQNEERKRKRKREVEDELFLNRSPMFIAARAAHAKIRDTQRGKKPHGALALADGRRIRRESRLEPWRDGCRPDLRVRMAYAEKRTVRNGASSHGSRVLGRTLPTGRLSAGRQTPESTRSPICLSNKKPGEAAS